MIPIVSEHEKLEKMLLLTYLLLVKNLADNRLLFLIYK